MPKLWQIPDSHYKNFYNNELNIIFFYPDKVDQLLTEVMGLRMLKVCHNNDNT